MKVHELDDLDQAIIMIINDKGEATAQDVYMQASKAKVKKITRSIILQRLVRLVERDYIDMRECKDQQFTYSLKE